MTRKVLPYVGEIRGVNLDANIDTRYTGYSYSLLVLVLFSLSQSFDNFEMKLSDSVGCGI